jgi:hypothetical protein
MLSLSKHADSFVRSSHQDSRTPQPMNLFADFQAHLVALLDGLKARGVIPAGADLKRAVIEAPRDAAHGDLATNAAMVLAKEAGMKPRDLAEMIAEGLRALPGVTAVDIAGPGFINIRLETDLFDKVLGGPQSVLPTGSMLSMFRPIPPGRCMSAIAVARFSVTHWQA